MRWKLRGSDKICTQCRGNSAGALAQRAGGVNRRGVDSHAAAAPDRGMIRTLLLGMTLLLASCGGKPVPVQDADPALWVVRDGDTTIYLFGTVHLLRPGMGWFDDRVKTAFDASGELVLELVMPPEQDMQ